VNKLGNRCVYIYTNAASLSAVFSYVAVYVWDNCKCRYCLVDPCHFLLAVLACFVAKKMKSNETFESQFIIS